MARSNEFFFGRDKPSRQCIVGVLQMVSTSHSSGTSNGRIKEIQVAGITKNGALVLDGYCVATVRWKDQGSVFRQRSPGAKIRRDFAGGSGARHAVSVAVSGTWLSFRELLVKRFWKPVVRDCNGPKLKIFPTILLSVQCHLCQNRSNVSHEAQLRSSRTSKFRIEAVSHHLLSHWRD